VATGVWSIPSGAQEEPKEGTFDVSANFLKVGGPESPLCWIPVDDVKAVVMLLATHQPKSDSLKIVQAQFAAVIGHLNQYIEEAQERVAERAVVMTSWTCSGGENKDK
jgi:hypothetical protein